ncbi:5'-methylthioadenosine/adenosylhomocysteine nucleosidase [Helicobacter suis]|uniref:5'-methylthioadenosine/adenosylhomocysteine nucleosidase n=1 Tax=Helicobacter suis TaxID=104628 RepID=UPI0013D8543F|nr:5'-methylthioadenosine/adenosylhomocysteine nucleosidase [Helicobacter suis]
MPTFKTIGVMGAMQEEITPLLEIFSQHRAEKVGNNTFYIIPFKNTTLILAYSKIGKVHAATTASIMILRYGVEALIFSGVAGGLATDLEINDLILATKLCQADVNLSAFGHPLGFIPESSVFVESNSTLNALAKDVAHSLNIELKEGIVATCDQFVNNPEIKQTWHKIFGAAVVEMEGASMACICRDFNIPFCVLRSVSDKANGEAPADFDLFLHESAKISARFVYTMLERLVKSL